MTTAGAVRTTPGKVGPGQRVLFIFLDGVGLAPAGPGNPFSQADLPNLNRLLGGPLVLATADGGLRRPGREPVLLRPLDARLGVEGLPQSATGQTALFTGLNAPALAGDHVTAYPTALLRGLIAEHSLLKRAAACGRSVLFANAHSEKFWQMVRSGRRALGASTLTALAADATIPTLDDLQAGRAVLWDITHEVASRHLGYDLPLVTPEEAGRRLAGLSDRFDLVLYETFLPDLAGHGRVDASWVLERLDAFLGSVVAQRSPEVTMVVSSDHGNLEDLTTRAHTLNPVPLLAAGPGAHRLDSATDITHVAPGILAMLDCPAAEPLLDITSEGGL